MQGVRDMTCSHYAQTHISDCLQGELEGGRNWQLAMIKVLDKFQYWQLKSGFWPSYHNY